MSFPSKIAAVLDVQLKVQKLAVKLADPIVSASGSTITVAIGENVSAVRSAIHCDDSVGLALITQANVAISGGDVTLTLAAPMAANDCVLIEYVISE